MAKKKIPTVDSVYEHCKKIDPDKFKDLQKSEIDIRDSGLVLVRGRFVKGYTGNVKKKGKTATKLTPEQGGITAEDLKVYGKDAKKALEHLLKTAKSRTEVERISSKLIPYQSPKLSNIESFSHESKTIEITWGNSDKSGNLIDITPEEYKIQEEAAKLIIEDKVRENVEGLMEIPKGEEKEKVVVGSDSDGDG